MPLNDAINIPRRGGYPDLGLMNVPEGTFLYCLNGAMEAKSGDPNKEVVSNDGSNLLAINFPEGFAVIGRQHITEQNRTLFFLTNPTTGFSQIGEVLDCNYDDESDDIESAAPCADCDIPIELVREPLETITQVPYCTYQTIVNSDCLGFDINYPIRVRYRITDCSLNLYFTDRKSERRFVYFDYNPDNTLALQNRFKVISGFDTNCNQPIYQEQIDCNKILYHPHYDVPCLDLVEVTTGGSLLAGTYQFLSAYADVEGNELSDFTAGTQIIPVFTRQITFETNYPTDKSIRLKLNHLDSTDVFLYYTVVVAETIDNFTTFKKLGVFPTSQTTIDYTGNEILQKLTADDIFFKRLYYQKAGNVTNANDFLFFSDLLEYHKPNLQRVANNIKLYWQTAAIPEAVYKDPQNSFRFRSADRDEVYPYGVIFTMDNGQEFGPYHIPSLSATYLIENYAFDVNQIIDNDDVQQDTSCSGLDRNKLWQVYNTAFIISNPHEVIKDCDFNHVWEWGEFSYWESIRTYPNEPAVWGDLCGKPIRHHKYPDSSVTHIHDGLSGVKKFSDNNIVYPIGVRVDHNSVKQALIDAVVAGIITQADSDRIIGYRIIRGNRVGNESNIAKGLLFDVWNYSKNNKTYYYPNYPYNDLRPDYFIAPTSDTYKGSNTSLPTTSTFASTKRYTFHSPDTHFKNPTIGTEIKLETLEYGQSEGFFNLCDLQSKQKFLSTAATTLALVAGVAAAFATDNKTECKTIVNKNYQMLTGTSPGAFLTTPAVPLVNTPVPIITSGVAGIPDIFGPAKYDPVTGLAIPDPFDPAYLQATEVHQQTCRSKTFHNLDNPLLVGFLQQLIYLGMLAMKEMQIIEDLIKALSPLKNLSIQYNSAGKYNNYLPVLNNGNKIRAIDRSAYLEPNIQLINEAIDATTNTFSNVYVNNWNRERSVYLKTDTAKSAFPSPAVADTSRVTMNNAGLAQEDLLKRFNRSVSSYYGTIKRFIPDQYGNIGDIQYVETNGCNFNLASIYGTSETGVFGGDKFITRFALKRKMPFFLQTRFRFLPEADVEYSELGNVGFPNYYFNTDTALLERVANNTFTFSLASIFDGALLQDLLGVAATRLDARKNKFFYQSGFIHLYNYGIPYFLVESDVNTDFRYGQNSLEKDFYPHQQDLEFWLQEKNVPITEDNYYFYNKSYSKQDKESFISVELPKEDLRECTVVHPDRVISSLPTSADRKIDNWLIFRPNDFFDFPLQFGKLVGLDGIEQDKVLVRFENTAQIFNAYDVLKTDSKEIQIGNGGLFSSRPKEFSSTDLGYAGTQNIAILQTEFGHIWTDAERGQILNLEPNARGLGDITEGMEGWFQENLKFRIKQDFPKIELRNLDNNYKGIGLHLSFDKRFKRMFITKLDYKKINRNVTYNPDTNDFYFEGKKISVYDERYFCNKSFTVSYSFKDQNWMYHSFTPNYYVDNIKYIQSGINFVNRGQTNSSLWSHNLTNKSYQVYYGKLCPFILEIPSEGRVRNNPYQGESPNPSNIINSVTYDSTALRYHNHYDYSYDRLVTFNKAWVYNERQHSGELNLNVRNENDMVASVSYPKVVDGKQQILVTNKKNKWSFNQFWDTVNTQKGNIPFVLNTCSNADKVLNLPALNYFKPDIEKAAIRGATNRIRLIQDANSTHKIFAILQKINRTEDES